MGLIWLTSCPHVLKSNPARLQFWSAHATKRLRDKCLKRFGRNSERCSLPSEQEVNFPRLPREQLFKKKMPRMFQPPCSTLGTKPSRWEIKPRRHRKERDPLVLSTFKLVCSLSFSHSREFGQGVAHFLVDFLH